jgi:hypothetical protein
LSREHSVLDSSMERALVTSRRHGHANECADEVCKLASFISVGKEEGVAGRRVPCGRGAVERVIEGLVVYLEVVNWSFFLQYLRKSLLMERFPVIN